MMRLAVVLLVAVARALSVLPASPRALAAGGARCHAATSGVPRISSSSSIVARADDSHMAPEYREAGKGSQIISLLEKAGSPLLSWLERKLDSWRKRYRPKRIILVRHGQSVGNIDSTLYGTIPDSQISLTERGFAQGAACGLQIRRLVGNETTRFYYSPYLRARQTLLAILDAFQNTGEVALVAEPRLREQDFGNFQDPEGMATVFRERQKFGRFYYRFPNGEAGTDVYDRMSDFQATLFSQMDAQAARSPSTGSRRFRDGGSLSEEGGGPPVAKSTRVAAENYVLVTHGLLMRVFCMVYLRWTVKEFEQVWNPSNCEIWVLERNDEKCVGDYQLAGRWRASPVGGNFVDIKYGENRNQPLYPHMKRPMESRVISPGPGCLDGEEMAHLRGLPGPQSWARSSLLAGRWNSGASARSSMVLEDASGPDSVPFYPVEGS